MLIIIAPKQVTLTLQSFIQNTQNIETFTPDGFYKRVIRYLAQNHLSINTGNSDSFKELLLFCRGKDIPSFARNKLSY